jgi:alkanesulfonate monooxygenase SsuD/methylene tetrahydromethanopterin reductase-like flavin-dependent oxidoreductase (luciferase family)
VTNRVLFGIQTPATRTWPEMLELWGRIEALGFDSAWLPDHLVPPFNPNGPLLESWTLLAALAARVPRVRLGILVSSNTFRHPPLLAKQAVTVDHASGGRLELGIGAGWFAPEHGMFGLRLPEPPELVGRFREAVELIDLLLRQDVTSYEGRFYVLREAPFRPSPLQRPRIPLTLGAHGRTMLGIVARYADRWNSTGTVAEMAERNRVLDERCAEVGRDPGAVLRSHLYVAPQLAEERPWDSPEAFRDFVGRFREAGVGEFLLQPPPPERFGVVERVAAEVLPALRAGEPSADGTG